VLSEGRLKGGSNNIAGLIAVRLALRWAKANGLREILVLTDSRNKLGLGPGEDREVGERLCAGAGSVPGDCRVAQTGGHGNRMSPTKRRTKRGSILEFGNKRYGSHEAGS
jgi:hypothetical protein